MFCLPKTAWPPTSNPIVRNVTPEEAYRLVTQGRVLVLDVREVYEFNLGHIKGPSPSGGSRRMAASASVIRTG